MVGLLGSGEFLPDERDSRIAELEEQVENLQDALKEARDKLTSVSRGQAKLKQTLSPLFNALKIIFGEMKDVEVDDAPAQSQGHRGLDAWEKWKHKVPGKPAEFIDAMLEHGPMTVQQLIVATRTPRKQTIYDAMHKLSKMNLVERSGDKYALKEL